MKNLLPPLGNHIFNHLNKRILMFKKLSLLTAGLLLSVSVFANDIQDLIQKANSGNMVAQYNLGAMYYYGKGVKQDYKNAVEWFLKSANQNNANAQYMLGVIYGSSYYLGAQQDYKKSIDWLTKSANQNHIQAQMLLGLNYEYGMGVRQNKRTAKELFGKACDNGHQAGCVSYRTLDEQGY